jgi:hypothetical protein
VNEGCKIAISGMHGNNGIAKSRNDTFYVGNSMRGGVSVLEKRSNNTLVLTDTVATSEVFHSVSLIWAAVDKYIISEQQVVQLTTCQ